MLPELKGAILQAITRTALLGGPITLVFTWGKSGQFLLMIAWMGFLAEWVIGKLDLQEGRLKETQALLERAEKLNEANASLETHKNEESAE